MAQNASVQDVKFAIEEREAVPFDLQRLTFCGKSIENDESLLRYFSDLKKLRLSTPFIIFLASQ